MAVKIGESVTQGETALEPKIITGAEILSQPFSHRTIERKLILPSGSEQKLKKKPSSVPKKGAVSFEDEEEEEVSIKQKTPFSKRSKIVEKVDTSDEESYHSDNGKAEDVGAKITDKLMKFKQKINKEKQST